MGGFGFDKECAIASTVSHDSHNLLVVGNNEEMMSQAVSRLVEIGGGQVVIKEGKIIGEVNLPIAGLMSNQNARLVADQAASVVRGFAECGCEMNNPNMQLSLLALAVIPDLRLTNKGLVDVKKFEIIPVISEG
jgi:adenine deaminase